jgi:hypothetical protein
VAAAAAAAPVLPLSAADKTSVTAPQLPRWRGFNLLEKFIKQPGGNSPFRESDFALMDLGIAQSTRGYDPMQSSYYQASGSKARINGPNRLGR